MKAFQLLKEHKNKILVFLLAILVIMQFFPIDKTNPAVIEEQEFLNIMQPPESISNLLKNACFDCHSNHSKYPWYTNIAPLSWWIKGHIDHGRGKLNFSEWGSYSEKKANHKIEELVEFVSEKRMPLLSYIIAHPEARLTKEEREEIVEWFSGL